jgi:hypothetical protein
MRFEYEVAARQIKDARESTTSAPSQDCGM